MAYLFQWNWTANGAKKSERNFGSGYGPGVLACCIQANGKCQMLGTVNTGTRRLDLSEFLAATSSSKNVSVRPSVCLLHLFHYVPIIASSWNFHELLPVTDVMLMQKVKVNGQGHRGQTPV